MNAAEDMSLIGAATGPVYFLDEQQLISIMAAMIYCFHPKATTTGDAIADATRIRAEVREFQSGTAPKNPAK